jgi:hypothetical protein
MGQIDAALWDLSLIPHGSSGAGILPCFLFLYVSRGASGCLKL